MIKPPWEWLNYHHPLYFWTVARIGSVSRAGEGLRLIPSDGQGAFPADNPVGVFQPERVRPDQKNPKKRCHQKVIFSGSCNPFTRSSAIRFIDRIVHGEEVDSLAPLQKKPTQRSTSRSPVTSRSSWHLG
jgi:hypothetical protein